MLKKIVLVGNPNVGKSLMFNLLTGSYTVVSNYPGTTVEVTRGKGKIGREEFEIIDTPGMYSLLPISEEERVARAILLTEQPEIVIQMVDAKNLDRMLGFTIQLIEAALPVILVLNIMDEAERAGKKINVEKLEEVLSIPVVAAVSTSGIGIEMLKERILNFQKKDNLKIKYSSSSESVLASALDKIGNLLKGNYVLSKKTIGLLLFNEDREIKKLVEENDADNFAGIGEVVQETKKVYGYPLDYLTTMYRQQAVEGILKLALTSTEVKKISFQEKLSRLTMHPFTGIPILLLVLYWGLYKFVGGFGSGTLVDFLEVSVFEKYINPFVVRIFASIIPWKIIQDLFVGDYGMITLGLRYSVAIIMPIVAMFFLIFSIIEDSGYLPRLALLIDRLFKKIGLSGRAVIPMVLGVIKCPNCGYEMPPEAEWLKKIVERRKKENDQRTG